MSRGFTLIELIIVICIIILLTALFWPIGAAYYQREILNKTEQQMIWTLKLARANAINQKNNSSFGIYIKDNQLILFQGESYAQRDASKDIIYDVPSSVKISGAEIIIFAVNTGLVNNPGLISLRTNSTIKEIKINELGVIDY
jgi:prepilin-type N-terminal cleavage/methylation domain-containing protein